VQGGHQEEKSSISSLPTLHGSAFMIGKHANKQLKKLEIDALLALL